ncbi:menaquinone-dependent protoporphyrinogen IX dehydrogenase [Ferrimonas balearica]|uniref:menaquinone-dependent protoporphyrinogen IX dehydrogenase n=1 Tax=Ferrimonas balearica TaxID=44012 RepID=UPI001C98AB06|nr:menaquinone-dependent protoporphyrinogen IX dehydrogenase [Ferrimonas balearica]MBY5979573.1 menaquinone-dependent protoporphyrinogen IX dehydrogenase [Ferrimonas balearica]
MSKTLLIYASQFGQTHKICLRIAEHLQSQGETVEMKPLAEAPQSLDGYGKVLLACSIYHGKYRPELYQYITDHQAELDAIPNAFFSVNLVARKPHKNAPDTNPYVKQFLQKTPWQPKLLGVFGGVIHYQRYNWFDRNIIRFIMWLTKGPTDPNSHIEYTQWERVDQFATEFAGLRP